MGGSNIIMWITNHRFYYLLLLFSSASFYPMQSNLSQQQSKRIYTTFYLMRFSFFLSSSLNFIFAFNLFAVVTQQLTCFGVGACVCVCGFAWGFILCVITIQMCVFDFSVCVFAIALNLLWWMVGQVRRQNVSVKIKRDEGQSTNRNLMAKIQVNLVRNASDTLSGWLFVLHIHIPK